MGKTDQWGAALLWWARVGVRPGHLLGLLSLQQTYTACIQHLSLALQRRSLGKDSYRKIMIRKQSQHPHPWLATAVTDGEFPAWEPGLENSGVTSFFILYIHHMGFWGRGVFGVTWGVWKRLLWMVAFYNRHSREARKGPPQKVKPKNWRLNESELERAVRGGLLCVVGTVCIKLEVTASKLSNNNK